MKTIFHFFFAYIHFLVLVISSWSHSSEVPVILCVICSELQYSLLISVKADLDKNNLFVQFWCFSSGFGYYIDYFNILVMFYDWPWT